MSEKKLNVTKVSKVIFCDRTYFEENSSSTTYEYCLFIVESPGNQTYELYYGQRKLSSISIVTKYPKGKEFPSDRIYLIVNSDRSLLSEFLYRNKDGVLVDLNRLLTVRESSYDSSLLKLSTESGVADLIAISDNGVATDIVKTLVSKAVDSLKKRLMCWGSF